MRESPRPHSHVAHPRLDRFGVVLSGLCMVHCLAGVFLIGLLGAGGEVLLNPAIHRVGLMLALVIGAATIGANALRHGHRLPLGLGMAGLGLMAGAVLSAHGTGEAVLTIGGVALVAGAHILNLRRIRLNGAPCC